MNIKEDLEMDPFYLVYKESVNANYWEKRKIDPYLTPFARMLC